MSDKKRSPSGSAGVSLRASLRITLRVAMGFAALTLLLLNTSIWLGLIPDRREIVMSERRILAESLAIGYSGLMQLGTPEQIKPILEEIVYRIPGVASAGVRDKDGHLLIDVGNHESQWTNREGTQSTDEQLKVMLTTRDALWGQLELRFGSPAAPSVWSLSDIERLLLFVTLGGLLLYGGFAWFVLRRALTMTTSEAIPKRIRASLNTLAEGVLLLDKQNKVVLANTAFAGLLGRVPEEVEGADVASLPWSRSEKEAAESFPWEQSSATGQPYTGVVLGLIGKKNFKETLSVNSTPILGMEDSYRGAMVTFDNLTTIEKKNRQLRRLLDRLKNSRAKIQKQNETLSFLANHDPLTHSLNRRAFFEALEGQWSSAGRYHYPLSVIMTDIDHFKRINDTYGHATGDDAIRHVVKILEGSKRGGDIIGRYGGEEFVVLLPHVDIEEATAAADRLRQLIEQSPCGKIPMTISMGVSTISFGAKTANEMLQQADEALYAAKHSGRNRVCRWDIKPEGASQPVVAASGSHTPKEAHAPR